MAFLTRRKILGLGLAGLGTIAVQAAAHGPSPGAERVGPYDIRVEDAAGVSLPNTFHEGRRFVLGEKGQRYAIVISNPTAERVEAVVSVDGRDAISGRVASYRVGRGYIVPPYGTVTMEGFRQSMGEVASFRFVDPMRSYTARLGTPENVGVIGVAIFKEKPRPSLAPRRFREEWRPRDGYLDESHTKQEGYSAKAPAKGASRGASHSSSPRKADAREPRRRDRDAFPREREPRQLGTEYGETRESRVVEVPFERRSRTPEMLTTLHYDSAAGLRARGIHIDGDAAWLPPEPEAFPDSRFAAPP